MRKVSCFLRQAGDNPLYPHIDQILYIPFFMLERLVRCRDNDEISVIDRHVLYPVQNGGKEMSDNIRNDHSDDARRILSQTHSERIGTIIHLFGQLLGFGAKFTADFRAVFQCSGYSRDGYA